MCLPVLPPKLFPAPGDPLDGGNLLSVVGPILFGLIFMGSCFAFIHHVESNRPALRYRLTTSFGVFEGRDAFIKKVEQ